MRSADDPCTLTYAYARRTHRNRYSNHRSQFGINPYAEVLIDPKHPGTMYTADDVLRDTNTGFGVLGIFGLVATALSAFATFWLGRAVRRYVPITDLRPEPSASAPASARAALLAVYAAEDALYDGMLPSRAMTYRFDPDELERAFGHLGERLVAMPGLEPEVRAIPTELERVWHRVAIIALR